MEKRIKKIDNPETAKFQLYTEIPGGKYKLVVSSVYYVNRVLYINCLFKSSDTLFPVLFIQFNPQKSVFSLPSIFFNIENGDEVLKEVRKKILEININSLDGNPKTLVFDEYVFEKLLPIDSLNTYRFPSVITSDIASIMHTIARYSHVRNLLKDGDNVLDFGCGTGLGSFILSKNKDVEITAIDIDKPQIEFAKRLYNPRKVYFSQGDIFELNLKGRFDLVISSEVFEHTENWNHLLSILKDLLKENGSIFITLPNFYYHTSALNSDHRIDWTKRKVEKFFGVKPLYLTRQKDVFGYKVDDIANSIPEIFLFSLPKHKKQAEDIVLKRVLFVNHSIYPLEKSGTPLSTYEQAKGLKERGIKTGVLIPDYKVQNTYKKEDLDGIVIYKIPALDWKGIWLNTFLKPRVLNKYLILIEEIVEDFDPQIVHINDYVSMCPQIVKFFSDLGCRVIRWVHADEEICWRTVPVIEKYETLCSGPDDNESTYAGKIYAHLEYTKLLYRNFVDAVVFASESFKKHFTGYIPISKEKIKIIPIGFEKKSRGRIRTPEDKIVFGFLGLLNFCKGANLLCDAIKKLIDDGYKGFEIRIFGGIGQYKYHKKIKEMGEKNPDIVKYYGEYFYEDLDKILEEIDVGLVLSYWESHSRVLREFLIRGIPVICTDFLGSEIVKDRINGFKVPVEDGNKIYEIMAKLIKEKGLVKDLSREALETEIPSKEDEVNLLLDLYSSLLKKKPLYERQDNIKTIHYPKFKDIDFSYLSDISSYPEVEKIERLENTLVSIYNSRVWKIFSIYQRIKNTLFPIETKRRKLLDKLLFSERKNL